MAKGTNVELNPQAKTPPKPSLGYKSDLASIPALNVHGHNANFPGLPNNPGDVVDVGQKADVDHGWFHS